MINCNISFRNVRVIVSRIRSTPFRDGVANRLPFCAAPWYFRRSTNDTITRLAKDCKNFLGILRFLAVCAIIYRSIAGEWRGAG